MKNILAEESSRVIDTIAHERLPLVFDFDGTLAPLVDDPESARMHESTRTLLRLVSLLHPCAVISGRSRADVTHRLDGIPLVAIIGNHGAEAGHGPVDRSDRALVTKWCEQARRALSGVEGVEVEDKRLSLAIHYRRAASPDLAERAITAAAKALTGARLFRGHAVVNVVPPHLHDKGVALAGVLSRIGRDRAMYVGDDTTDEDAFRSKAVQVGVRVGPSPGSAAAYYVPLQADVDDLLRALIRARRRQDGLSERFDGLEQALR
jgi:trehalose 6-phosphate phosphatase